MWKLAVLLSSAALIVMTVPAILLTVTFAGSEVETISGTVRFVDGETELPAGACVEVVLVDVSDEDALAVALGWAVIEDPNTLPVNFQVAYDRDRLTPGATHELWVAVRHEGNLLYATTGDHPVDLGTSASSIEVAVGPVLAMP